MCNSFTLVIRARTSSALLILRVPSLQVPSAYIKTSTNILVSLRIMPSIPISIAQPSSANAKHNPLPQLLQTPHGLAIIEIQGTLNMPALESGFGSKQIGKLTFPNLEDGAASDSEGAWMKKVHLYVGQNQRLVGEVKKLGKPYGVLRRRDLGEGEETGNGGEELEIVDVVRWKIFFGARPEFV